MSTVITEHFPSNSLSQPDTLDHSYSIETTSDSSSTNSVLTTTDEQQQDSEYSESITTSQIMSSSQQKISGSTRKFTKIKSDSDYIFFGYIPNVKVPIINIQISYPIEIVSNKLRFFTSKLGFSEKGITKKSVASIVQSFIYGGNIPRNSVFSYLQSFSSVSTKKPEVESNQSTTQ